MNKIALFDQINNSFGFNLRPQKTLSTSSREVRIPGRLFNDILTSAESIFGGTVLKMSASPEDYMRYKNGRISSIIKGESGFGSHVGFESVQLVSIVDHVFAAAQDYYTEQILSEFHRTTSDIFRSIDEAKQHIYQQAYKFKEMDIAEELSSFSYLFAEIAEEIESISSSQARAQGYITNLISVKRSIYKIYEYCIKKLHSWISIIDNWNQYRLNEINYNELRADYLLCRQAISCYMICLVYEHIISGCIDEQSKIKIEGKIRKFTERFKEVDRQIRQTLQRRDNSNTYFDWYNYGYYFKSSHHHQDSNSIRWFLSNFGEDSELEIKKVNEIFEKSRNILNNITFIIDDSDNNDPEP